MEYTAIYERLRERFGQEIASDDELMALFEANGKIIHVPKKKLLITPGTMDDNAYFIARGAFLMSIVTEEGFTKTTAFYLDHYQDFITCPDSAYFHVPTMYEVRAVEDAVVVRFSRKFLDQLLDTDHRLLKYQSDEQRRTWAITNKIRDARIALSSAKFLQLLYAEYPLLFQRFPSQNIAEFMGITPVWLSNLKRKTVFLN